MKLFWKIYCVVLVSFVAVIALSSYVTSAKRISEAEKSIAEEHQTIGSFIASDIERGQSESKWPFESFKRLSEHHDFIFWWIVREDGIIHLADKASFIGSHSYDYFPQMAGMSPDGDVLLNSRKNYGIFIKSFRTGKHRWTFWLGFSTKHIAEIRRKIILSTAIYSASALVILGFVLYFMIIHFIRPVKSLADGVERIGKGDLNHRVQAKSDDELGYLAHSFNKMTENLQRITTSIDNLNTANQQLEAGKQHLKAVNRQLQSEIAERKKAQEKATTIIQTAHDGFWINDLKGQFIDVNDSYCKIIGYTRAELLTMSIPDIEAVEKPEETAEHLKKVVEQGHDQFETRHRRKDGKIIDIDVSVKYFDEEGGQMVVFLRDVTERKRAERAMKRLNHELEEVVEKLGRANSELKDFVYIASHDLREPMRKISSFGELLKDSLEDKLEEDDKENLEFMIHGANRMTAMIDGLLTYSRVAAKATAFETVDLNEIVGQLEQVELAKLLEETGAAIEVPQPLPKVKAEPVQIRQLLQNLVINGIRYRREGIQPRVVIRAEQIADGQVKVEVEDNGIGIAKEYREDVFKMFKRLHSRQKYEGTGIGLAVCKKIVERHNGQIGVESEAGAGSTFWFTLPVSDSSRQEQRKLVSSLET